MADFSRIRYTRSGEASIAYAVGGDGPIDLLVIPGFVSHLEIALELPRAQRFWGRVASFARLIAFDKRGTGLSDREAGAYTIETIVEDALAVLDAVGVERAAVFGVSEGGSAATMLAATHPDRVSAMVQYGTYARMSRSEDYPEGIPEDALRTLWSRLDENWGDPESARWFAPSMARDPELREWWGRLLRSGASPRVVRSLAEMYVELDVRPLLPTISVPTLVLYRAGDRMIPPPLTRTVAEGIPGAQAVELSGEDHLFLAGDQDPLIDAIEEFLTGRPAQVVPDRALATVLFTDVVESTRTAAELGDRRWRELLERYDRLGRREVERQGGRVIKATGDGLLASFDGPARGVRAALAARDGAREIGLATRAGLHTGECELLAEDIGGIAVHIAARIESSAEPDEVAVTGTLRDLVIGSGLEFRDRGTVTLKGVPGEWRIHTVTGDSEQRHGGRSRPGAVAAQRAARRGEPTRR